MSIFPFLIIVRLVKKESGQMKKFSDLGLIQNLEQFVETLKYNDLEFIWEPQSLYHYTSSNSLQSILKNKVLWLSKSEFLNDRNELKYTIDLVNEIITEMMSDEQTLEELVFKESINNYLKRSDDLFEVYVLSLSKNKDSNLLWSNYATDDGYNIEFQYPNIALNLQKQFDECFGEGNGTIQPYYVIYDLSQQRKLIEKEIQNLYRIFKFCFQKNDDDLFLKSASKPLTNIFHYSVFFKDKCFSQEEEFRVAVIVQKNNISNPVYNCRTNKGVFIPYISLAYMSLVNESPINSVVIGPKNNLDIAEDGLRYYLDLCEFKECSIHKSVIPYRY